MHKTTGFLINDKLNKTLVLISSVILWVMCFENIFEAICIAGMIFVADRAYVTESRIGSDGEVRKTVADRILAVFFCVINTLFFYKRWIGFAWVEKLAQYTHLGTRITLFVFSVICGIVSYPFVVYAFNWLLSKKECNASGKSSRIIQEKRISYILLVVSFLGVFVQLYFSSSYNIVSDESFSLAMIRHSYSRMIELTAADVHPPLYYFILKFGVGVMQSVFPRLNVITCSKFVSLVPFLIMLVLAAAVVRKREGKFTAALWSMFLVGMPSLIELGDNIRMYSWAILFVTMAYLFFYKILQTDAWIGWLGFMFSSLAAAYTHYYACVAVAVFYGILLVYALARKQTSVKKWLLTSGLTIAGYFPWLRVFMNQAKSVGEDYWISRITGADIFSYLIRFLGNSMVLFAGIVIMGYIIVDSREKKAAMNFYAFVGMCEPIAIILVGVAISISFRPVFVARYILPGLGCLWLGVAIYLSRMDERRGKFWVISLLIISSVSSVGTCCGQAFL